MKIICIFADHLFAIHFEDETYNELRRLLILWNDTSYLHHFVMQNKSDIPQKTTIPTLINQLIENANEIDKNCFVITGGTIKFHHLNKDRIHTQNEMQKIEICRDYLKNNGVFDADSFYEFLKEQL